MVDARSESTAGIRREDSAESPPAGWIWKHRLSRGGLTFVAGNPGVGKSQVLLWIAAAVTTGRAWPDGSENAPLGDVVIIPGEDRPDDTIKPRLMALGADVKRITLIEDRYVKIRAWSKSDEFRLTTLGDIDYWNSVLNRRPGVSLIIVDPLPDPVALGSIQSFLSEIVAPRGICMLASLCVNRPLDSEAARDRVRGPSPVASISRNIHVIYRDSGDPSLRHMDRVKCNDDPDDPPPLTFRIERRVVRSKAGETIETATPVFTPA